MAMSSGVTTDKVKETPEGPCVVLNKATLGGDGVHLDIKPENPGLSDREEFEVSVTVSCAIDSSYPFQRNDEVIPGDNVVELVESHCIKDTDLIAMPQSEREEIDIVNIRSDSIAPLHLNTLSTENAGEGVDMDAPSMGNCTSNNEKKYIDTRTVNCASLVECLDANSSVSSSNDEEGKSSAISFDKTLTNVTNQIVTPQPPQCLTNALLLDASVMIKDCKSAQVLEVANVETLNCATDLERKETISSIRSGKDSVLAKSCKSSKSPNSGCIVNQNVVKSPPKKIKKKKKPKIANQSVHCSSVNFREDLLNQTVDDYGITQFSIKKFTEIFHWNIGSVEPRNQTPASGHTQPSILNSIINNDALDSESQYESALPEEYSKNLPFVYNNSKIGEYSGTMLPASQNIPMSAVPLLPKASKCGNKKKNKKKTKQKSGEVSEKDPLNDIRFSLYGSQLKNFPDGFIHTEIENCNVDNSIQSNSNIVKPEKEVNESHSRSSLPLGAARPPPFSLSLPTTSHSCISGSTVTSQVFTNSKKERIRNHNKGNSVKSSNKMCDELTYLEKKASRTMKDNGEFLNKKGKRIKVNNTLKSATKNDGHNSSSPALPSQKKEAKSPDKKYKKNFEDFWPLEKVLLGIQNGSVIESVIRINPRNYTEAYVTSPAGGQDILIDGILDRNRAMEGDLVAVLVKPCSEWRLERKQRKPTKSNDRDQIVEKIILETQVVTDSQMVNVVDDLYTDDFLNKMVSQGINELKVVSENNTCKCEILMNKETQTKIIDNQTIYENEVTNCKVSNCEETPTEVNDQTTNQNDISSCETSFNQEILTEVNDQTVYETDETNCESSFNQDVHSEGIDQITNENYETNCDTSFNQEILIEKNDKNINDSDETNCESSFNQEIHSEVNDQTTNETDESNCETCFNQKTHAEVNDQTINETDESNCEISFNQEIHFEEIDQTTNENYETNCDTSFNQEILIEINDQTINETDETNCEISFNQEIHPEINYDQVINENNNCAISVSKKAPQVTGKVVAILSEQHSRKCVGYLKPMKNKNEKFALFSPRDNRIPRLHIPREKCPPDFWVDPASKEDILYLAKIKKWLHRMFAVGEIVEQVGEVADPQAETSALLMDNDLDVSPYPESLSTIIPTLPSIITEEIMMNRADLRKECIFTIDPITAKDLDDALSCKELENGNLEIGVHISDVTYFLSEGSPLDIAVSKRATSVYLVDKVHHMLPVEMCLQCSLLPGEDKLSYSVLWEVTKEAKVISQRITRSVINSCVKLAYEHAQVIIENPEKELNPEDFPPIVNGFSVSDISKVVKNLQNIAVQLRDQRFDGGALRIDQTKVHVLLDSTGKPIAVEEYINKESHRLIEEFMLLANMTTAKFIYDKYPDVAFLRSHPEPHKHQLEALQELMAARGMHLNISSAGALQTTLTRYAGDDFLSKSRLTVLNILCAKTMARAKYFCTGECGEDEFWHYALSVPYYTHFTSPIRRYADVMVHRLLNAALGYCSKPSWTKNYVSSVAANCNKKKYSAKVAGEQSVKLYLSLYVLHHQPLIENAVVIDVKDHSFDVSVCRFGLSMRVYVTKMNVELDYDSNEKVSAMKIKWAPTENYPNIAVQVVELFTVVCIKITCGGKSLKLESELLHPQSCPLIADKSVLTTEEIK